MTSGARSRAKAKTRSSVGTSPAVCTPGPTRSAPVACGGSLCAPAHAEIVPNVVATYRPKPRQSMIVLMHGHHSRRYRFAGGSHRCVTLIGKLIHILRGRVALEYEPKNSRKDAQG